MNTLQALINFISKDKFSKELWKNRGLNSSSKEKCNKLNTFLNKCANELILSKKEDYKNCFDSFLSQLNSYDYDTEEREFIVTYFLELSEICGLDFKENLMKWMYGEEIYEFIKTQKSSSKDIILHHCTNCEEKFKTEILEREKGIPDFSYTIIKCNECSALNMIELGPEIKEFLFGNYQVIEHLAKSDFTKEKALEKLESLKIK
ncbi:DUF4844 domain-containing protein [Aureivirga sp. CE67]|uniref:DUF4844 domain-containing protein n=1 Tax=Aureivirga sp. CE67 TaxID=1788983 RepID=UPI0018C99FBE|nr:DUF4844 domain-containing protein [Aureivirga sp. CE67]